MAADKIDFRLMKEDDYTDMCNLLQRIRPRIAKLESEAIYRAICQDGLVRGNPIIIVADLAGQLIGYVIAVVDWRSYWFSFPIHHPILALRIAGRRTARRRSSNKALPAGVDSLLSSCATERCWRDSSPTIAKILAIGVDKQFRRRKVGKELYQTLFQRLDECRIHRVDARIDLDNVGSIHFHRNMGWAIEPKNVSFFATINTDQCGRKVDDSFVGER